MKKNYAYFSLVFFALTGCVLTNTPPRNSRYSVDITDLEKVDFYKDTWVYRHPEKKVTDYSQFIIPGVKVYENTAKRVNKKFRPIFKETGQVFHDRAVMLIAKNYKIANQAGPGVLRIEFNVIDIKRIVKLKKYGNESIVTDASAVGTKYEADCYDSVTNERVFALSTLYKGDEYAAYKDPNLLSVVELGFDEWLAFFKKRFDLAMQKTGKPPLK